MNEPEQSWAVNTAARSTLYGIYDLILMISHFRRAGTAMSDRIRMVDGASVEISAAFRLMAIWMPAPMFAFR